MTDPHDGHAAFALQLGDEVDDLRLRGHVECRGGLVGDEDVRVADQCHRDHHALALAAGQLMRVGAQTGFGIGQMNVPQQRQGAFAGCGATEPEVAARALSLIHI